MKLNTAFALFLTMMAIESRRDVVASSLSSASDEVISAQTRKTKNAKKDGKPSSDSNSDSSYGEQDSDEEDALGDGTTAVKTQNLYISSGYSCGGDGHTDGDYTRVYWPASCESKHCPLVLFQRGSAGWNNNYDLWLKAIAATELVVIAPTTSRNKDNTAGLPDCKHDKDLRTAYDWAIKMKDTLKAKIDFRHIGVAGHSAGGKHLQKFIAENRSSMKIEAALLSHGNKEKNRNSTEEYLEDIPSMFITSKDDEKVPPAVVRTLFEATHLKNGPNIYVNLASGCHGEPHGDNSKCLYPTAKTYQLSQQTGYFFACHLNGKCDKAYNDQLCKDAAEGSDECIYTQNWQPNTDTDTYGEQDSASVQGMYDKLKAKWTTPNFTNAYDSGVLAHVGLFGDPSSAGKTWDPRPCAAGDLAWERGVGSVPKNCGPNPNRHYNIFSMIPSSMSAQKPSVPGEKPRGKLYVPKRNSVGCPDYPSKPCPALTSAGIIMDPARTSWLCAYAGDVGSNTWDKLCPKGDSDSHPFKPKEIKNECGTCGPEMDSYLFSNDCRNSKVVPTTGCDFQGVASKPGLMHTGPSSGYMPYNEFDVASSNVDGPAVKAIFYVENAPAELQGEKDAREALKKYIEDNKNEIPLIKWFFSDTTTPTWTCMNCK